MAGPDLPPADGNKPDPGSKQPEADILFRESNIPPWRFAFLCVGSVAFYISLGVL